MGTSKGYISPTRPEWSNAKRAVSTLLRENDSISRSKAAAKFAEAVTSDGVTSESSFATAAGGILGVARGIATNGINESLKELGREDLIGKDPEQLLDELLNQFTNDKATLEDSLSADAISQAFEELEITTLEDLGAVDIDVLLQEMISAFVCISFDSHFEEKIGKGRSPAEKESILTSMHDYIKDTIHANLNTETINNIDFSSLSAAEIVSNTLREAFDTLKEIYGE